MNQTQEAITKIDEVIILEKKKLINYAKLKLTLTEKLWNEKYGSMDGEHWADKMKPVELKPLLMKFLKLYRDAYGKEFDHISLQRENFKCRMMWNFRKNPVEIKSE